MKILILNKDEFVKLNPFKIFIIAFIAILFNSCSPKYLRDFTKVENTEIKSLNVIPNNFTKAVYKTTLKVMGRELTGILLIKKTTDNEFRFVFMSEIGLKYFDLGITSPGKNPTNKTYYIMSALKRGEFESVLFDNFNKLISKIEINSEYISYSNPNNKNWVFRENTTKQKITYYTINKTVENIYWKSPLSGKSSISISEYAESIPQNIEISNKKYGVKIICKQIEE